MRLSPLVAATPNRAALHVNSRPYTDRPQGISIAQAAGRVVIGRIARHNAGWPKVNNGE
jgi:hypothetical protein